MATRRADPGARNKARGRQVVPQKKFPLVPVIAGVVIVALIAIAAVFLLRGPGAGLSGEVDQTAPGQATELMPSRDHVATTVDYNTSPPTSGNHAQVPAQVGFYRTTPPSDEKLVHSLEHGNVVMYWDPAKLDEAQFNQLKSLYDNLRSEKPCLILAQRTMDKPIAITSWGYLAFLDGFDEGALRAFWRDHVAQGPEFGPGQCG